MKLYIVLDNIRSAYNVGSIFRSADGVGAAQILICGISPDKTHPKVFKTALGSTDTVQSTYFKSTDLALQYLKAKKVPIYAVELTEDAKHFQKIEYPQELAIVLGHETEGVQRHILDQCDMKIFVPMRGKKESLNVATVAGIVMYEVFREKV